MDAARRYLISNQLLLKTLEVCFTQELVHLHAVVDKIVVVVDILRATSSMTTAFAHGVRCILPVANVEECLALQRKGYLVGGERDGQKVAGFDFGNSPFDYQQDRLRGQSVAMTTTNGTLTIERCKKAHQLIVGSFLNLTAVADYLGQQHEDVLIVCAGWKGHFNLEDTLFAGALAKQLSEIFSASGDATLGAQLLYRCAQPDLASFLAQSSHVQRLQKLGAQEDVDYCLQFDHYKVVPRLKSGHLMCD